MKRLSFTKLIFGVALLVTGAVAMQFIMFSPSSAEAEGGTPPKAPQAMPVTVKNVEIEQVRLWSSYSGRLKAVEEVALRPQVSGAIVDVRFEDGQKVHAGDILFVIDPRTFETAVKQAKAELDAARQNLTLAKKEKMRAQELVDKGNVSKRVFDERINAYTVAASRVRQSVAALEQAQIALDHAYVKSPINGRVSRVEITRGNYVNSGPNAPVLTTIVSTDDIYADFEIDEQRYVALLGSTDKKNLSKVVIPVELQVGNGTMIQGVVHSFDNRIDPNTGTIRTRAIFENKQENLVPGMFAKVNIGNPDPVPLIMISPDVINTDQDRKFVYAISKDNTVEYRQVVLGASQDGKRVVTSGLSVNDQVIVEGLMKLRPGMPVAPKPVQKSQS
ncbi:efflux RND transporter periplasmic adaptor subunit [Sneathiella aquimaris]|uniref:efflux RND transporter periplasmic adaptor subunit n=1 Tax=Sneathiella aquimaris TaxID=2599305 RepID=UPI001CA4F400|nr:efflux RND transporter periplasmic adaptor subunit [Sneathiella aquimaris]